MVKHLISSILFLCILQTGPAQTTPWFLSTNAFKEWVQRNHIKEIVELNPEFTNYESYKYYISISKHLKNKNLSQVEVHYCFDSLGELTMIKVTLKKIRLSDSDYQLQKDEYNKLYQKFEDIPYTLTDSILNEFVPVKGLEHLNFKSHRKFSSALIHNEEVISLSGSIKKTTENYFAFYEYDLLLKLNFSKGMLQSLESYYPGSIDTQGLPYYYKTWFEKERDSSYLLKTHSYVPRWIDERSMNRHISDTIENLSYYRNVFIGITEGDCFSDSLGNLIQNEPLIQYLETPTRSGSEFHIFSNGSKTLISLFDAYFNNSVSNSRANFGQSFHFYGPNMEKDEIFTWIPKGEFISNRKLDENGLLIRQSFSQVIDGKNQIIWVEKKTKEGYMRIQKTKKDEEHLTYFRFNRDGNFEVVENKIKDRKIIESKNRLEFTNNGFIADQNGSTNKITYIVYK